MKQFFNKEQNTGDVLEQRAWERCWEFNTVVLTLTWAYLGKSPQVCVQKPVLLVHSSWDQGSGKATLRAEAIAAHWGLGDLSCGQSGRRLNWNSGKHFALGRDRALLGGPHDGTQEIRCVWILLFRFLMVETQCLCTTASKENLPPRNLKTTVMIMTMTIIPKGQRLGSKLF